MSETPSVEKGARQEAARREIMDRLPGLMYERSRLQSASVEPTRVLLPARLNVPYDGPDATEREATLMGLPITWSDEERWGLIVTLPEPRTRVTSPATGREARP